MFALGILLIWVGLGGFFWANYHPLVRFLLVALGGWLVWPGDKVFARVEKSSRDRAVDRIA